jgi:hypothetical protein
MKERYKLGSLPKWAQERINQKDAEIERLYVQLNQLRIAHSILDKREWFTIGAFTPEKRNIYFLDKDHPNHVATIGAGSIMLIGHPFTDNNSIKQ